MVDLKSIKLENFWYFVGLLVTDGNLSKDGRHINISSKDTNHLEKVKETLGLKTKITLKSRGGNLQEKRYGFLQFSDVKLYRYLYSLGITQNKSLTIGAVKVPDKFFVDFLRGVIDGDGSIRRWIHATNGNEQWSLSVVSASKDFIVWLQTTITKLFGVVGRLHSTKKNLYLLKYGKIVAQRVLSSIYYEGALSLDRKALLARSCVVPNSLIRQYNARVV